MGFGTLVARASFLEIDRHDWGALGCACGRGAGHLPADIKALLQAAEPSQAMDIGFDGHVEDCSLLFECAIAAVPVILLALQEDNAQFVRQHLVGILWQIALGGAHGDETASRRRDISGECRAAIARGVEVIYREAVVGDTEIALEILEEIEVDRARLEYYKSALRGRLDKIKRSKNG